MAGAGGGGGGGGYGAIITGAGASTNTGAITGGNGGAGGAAVAGSGGTGGDGGDGGVGVQFTTSGGTFTNSGTVTGGNGGAAGIGIFVLNGSPGSGGAGIVGSGLTVINSGTIAGGLGGNGSTRANAITFTGGTNTLELQPGSSIIGNVVAASTADTLALGGSGSAIFDVSQIGSNDQYRGFGVFQKTGTSTWALTRSTGAVTPWAINGGTLAVSADDNLGNDNGGLSFNGGTLQYLSGFFSSRDVRLNSGGGTVDTNGNIAILAGTISGSGGLNKVGTGTLRLSGGSSYAGATAINAGTLQAGATNAFSASSAFTVASGATLDLDGFNQTIGSLAGGGSVTLGSATLRTGNDNTSTTFSGTMSGIGGLTKIGAGTLTLAGANIYFGGTTINAGTLAVSADNNLGNGSGTLALGGGTLQYLSGFTSNRAVTLNAGGGIFDTNGNNSTLGGTLSGIGGLTKIGAGTLTLSGANSYFGGTTINAGTLAVSADNNLGNGSGTLALGGGTLQYLAGFTSTRAVTLNSGGGIFDTNGNNATLGGTLSGIGGLTKIGAGTLTLSGVNTYTGATTVSAGTLQVDGLVASPNGVLVNSGPTLSGNGIVSSTTINNGGTLAPGANAVGALTLAGNLAFQSGASYLVQVQGSPNLAASTTFVTGSTTVAGTLNANALGGSYTASRIFSVLSSTGPLTGTFSALTTTGSFGGAALSLAYSPHEVFLILNAPATPLAWRPAPATSDWNTGTNWTTNTVPTATDIAQFDNSNTTTINIQQAGTQVRVAVQCRTPSRDLHLQNTGSGGVASSLIIQGDGVADISGNVPTFEVSGVSGALGTLQFNNSSTADDAIIITNAFGQTIFGNSAPGFARSNGGFARFITNAGGVVDFSDTSGPAGNNRITAGSIEGAGTYNLGSNMLVVGLNGLSTTVRGTINDGGMSGGTGASLVKGGRRNADLVGREHLHRLHGGLGRHAAGRGDQCLRAEQRVHRRERRHARSRRLQPDHRLARRRRQRDARLGHADHRQQQYQHDVRRHDLRHWRADQGRYRHADAVRRHQLFRRDGGQRGYAAGGRGECILGEQRVHPRERRHARSRRLQPDRRLTRRRRQRDARLGHADHRHRQYQHDVLRHDVRQRRAD